jgi:hypothetical protein
LPTDGDRLKDATLDLPAWPPRQDTEPCPTRRVTFVNGTYSAPDPRESVNNVVVGYVAGTPTYLAKLYCYGPGEGRVEQVVAYRADGDSFALLGKVVDSGVPGGGPDTHVWLGQTTVDGDAVTVEVGLQTVPGSAPPHHSRFSQRRTYTWQGDRFVQSGGPTTLRADPGAAKLTVSASRVTFQPPANGCRTGRVTVTVRNDGPQVAADVKAALMFYALGNDPGPCQTPANQGYNSYLATVGTLAAGQSIQVTATMVVADGEYEALYDDPYNYIQLRVGDLYYPGNTRIVVEFL